MKSLYFIGASIRLATQPFLQNYLDKSYVVDGPKESCGDSAYISENLERWLGDRNPDVILLNCGLHDIRYQMVAEKHQVELTEYKKNLENIFSFLIKNTSSEIIWQTITPINEAVYNCKKINDGNVRKYLRFEKDRQAYNDVSRDLVVKHGLKVIDFDELFFSEKIKGFLIDDGIHYSLEGYQKIAQFLAAQIIK